MRAIRVAAFAVLCVLTAIAALQTGAGRVEAAEISWNDYMQSSFVVGAIAAAMSRVEHCSKQPLLIEEIKEGDSKRALVFTCDGTEEEEGSSILHLERFGDGPWMAMRFDFAG